MKQKENKVLTSIDELKRYRKKSIDDVNQDITAPNHQLFERQDRCSIFSVLCYFRYFVRE